ncbi:DUF262 domain-containing protein [Chitinophaga silvatica]|nr:DUF262 domain-containing protein [Chitinophaga silvatica]
MSNELEKALTIKAAIDHIDHGDYLLPSIQRRFVWSTRQIEFLFDSIMQGYPINTFMFWSVTDQNIKSQFRFYDFLKKYVEYRGGNNEERATIGYKDFYAIIDGQQRLNSLYMGLKGSYAFKQYVYRKKNYHEDEKNYPSRKLYLDLLNPLDNDEDKKVYDFRFLIHNNDQRENENKIKQVEGATGNDVEVLCHWFEVGKILGFTKLADVVKYLTDEKLDVSGFPGETLIKLYSLINDKPLINYYLEKEQDFDKILYEFIRTNSGGTKLSFADLLMSIISASWDQEYSSKGAREEIDSVIREIREFGFEVDQDFILKTSLVLVSGDIRFVLNNFGANTINKIKINWGRITNCIKSAFELAKSLSFNNYSLRAKNAVIPVIYYLYLNNLESQINKENKHNENKELIRKYLHIILLNKLFSGSTDGFLLRLKKIITENVSGAFPLSFIKEGFKGSNKNFHIDDERISTILRTTYDNMDSFYVLSLLFPKFNFEFKNPNIDHLHPIQAFASYNYENCTELNIDYCNEYKNSVLNLTILSEEQNKSKNKSALKGWIEQQEKFNAGIREQLLIPQNVDLSFNQFGNFIQQREVLLTNRIKEIVEGN